MTRPPFIDRVNETKEDRIARIRGRIKEIVEEQGCSSEDAYYYVQYEDSMAPSLPFTKFEEVFEEWGHKEFSMPQRDSYRHSGVVGKVAICRSYCRIGLGYDEKEIKGLPCTHSVEVKPTEKIVEFVRCHMLHSEGVNFEIIMFPSSNLARVYANYSRIIGNRLLAIIDFDSIPKDAFKDDPLKEDGYKRTMSSKMATQVSKGDQFVISDDVKTVLKDCSADDEKLYLPDRQLDRKLYTDVKKIAEVLGGKWIGGKTQAFVFKGKDAWTVVAEALSDGAVTNHKKVKQAFYTPNDLASKMVRRLAVEPGMKVLEPSAGEGAIVKAILGSLKGSIYLDSLEIDQKLHDLLNDEGANVVGTDFMEYDPGKIYDRIAMNPPFRKGQDIAHVRRAFNMLKPGGRLVAIMSTGWRMGNTKAVQEFRDWLTLLKYDVEEIPAGAFKASGTTVATLMVTINA